MNNLIKDQIFKLFSFCGREESTFNMKLYYDRFIEKNISLEDITMLVDIAIDNNTYNTVPSFGKLIAPLSEIRDNKIEELTNTKWEYWIKAAGNPYEPLPLWANTIKQNIGVMYVENATAKEIPWIKKEFIEQYKLLLNKQLTLIEDKRDWKRIGNSWMLMPANNLLEG